MACFLVIVVALTIAAELAFSASHFAIQHLCNGGTFLCKIFQGAQEKRLISFLEEHFVQVKRWRPKASKSESSEVMRIAKTMCVFPMIYISVMYWLLDLCR